ncbi:alpha/beta hydrolase fold protein [Encephalitozoon intestinalis ATCC 50506]|uniref:Alpha/beta hydrolase fold protein n=1 Tax=Encephalitozoon intestinalis (strain ATCC 50506) TaxID=876142 RepID=E0S813_ENCIT|nr:alpha/beta hydrolase fold protein [Encephalitozoon intestinalis ATCC 50506]ADM11848.1 alpha/beta hydrolase fold protein [Encephalitozoon intestinalis ATCC 50506]UTX45600.1 hydrolase [Encephalitozoon intestinalis]
MEGIVQEVIQCMLGAIVRNNAIQMIILYSVFYFTRCAKRPDVFYSGMKRDSVFKMGSLHRSYYPLFFAPFGTIQTVLQLFRRPMFLERISIQVKTPHNGSILLDLVEGDKNSKKNALLVHGFNGSGNSTYMRGLAGHLSKEGYRVFCFNARGIRSKLNSPVFFHIGWTVDLKAAVEFILCDYQGTLEIFGFSMGANWVAKFFGEEKLDPRIIKGGAVCLPFDFFKIGIHFLKNPYTRLFNKLLAMNFVKYINRNKDVFRDAGYDMNMIRKCSSVQQIDMMVTTKIFDIKDVNEYYKNQSCVNYIDQISVPFIILNTYDDPIIPPFSIDKEVCMRNKNILLVIAHKGGHLGFLSNRLDRTWAEDVLMDFVKHF